MIRSVRKFSLFLESVMMIVILLFIYFISSFLQESIKSQFIKSQMSDINKVDVIIDSFMDQCRDEFFRFHGGEFT